MGFLAQHTRGVVIFLDEISFHLLYVRDFLSCGNFICLQYGMSSGCFFVCILEGLSSIFFVWRDATPDGTLLAVEALAADVQRALLLSGVVEHGSIGFLFSLLVGS